MPINHDAASDEYGEPVERSWDSKDSLLYSVGVGAGSIDPSARARVHHRELEGRHAARVADVGRDPRVRRGLAQHRHVQPRDARARRAGHRAPPRDPGGGHDRHAWRGSRASTTRAPARSWRWSRSPTSRTPASRSSPSPRRCSSAAKAAGAATAGRRARATCRRSATPTTSSPTRPAPTRRSPTACRATATRCTPTPSSPSSPGSRSRSCTGCARTASPAARCCTRCAAPTRRGSRAWKAGSRSRCSPATRSR